MSALSKYQKYVPLIGIIVIFIISQIIDDIYTGIEKDAKRAKVLGQAEAVSNESQLAISDSLPLVRYEAANNETDTEQFDEGLFSARVVQQTYVAPGIDEAPAFNVNSEINRYLTLVGTDKRGAYINGRFFMIGQNIDEFKVKNKEGELVSPKLVSVEKKSAKVSVSGEIAIIRFGS